MFLKSYLQNRNGHYHLRLRIPADLASLIFQSEIVKSLKTTSLKNAKDSSLLYLQGINQVFSLLRSGYISSSQANEKLCSLMGNKRKGKPQKSIGVAPRERKESRKLSKVISTYTADKEQEWTAKTKMESKGVFRILLDLIGDVAVDAIDRTKVRVLRDNLLKLPPNVYKVYPKLSPLKVLKLVDSGQLMASPMSLTTVNKHISYLSSLMLHCVSEGIRKDNPASGMKIKQKRRPDEERKAYDLDDIKKIADNLPRHQNKPERFWVPMICMLSGMRLEETCQLYKEDIVTVDGICCFDVNDSKDKKLKNLSSNRIIPVHPLLISIGLLEYVDLCEDGGRLWNNFKWCKVSGYSNSLGKWYQRFNREYVTQDKLKTFHSLRHSFADTLKQHGIQKELISELMGHSCDSITMSRYGKRFKAEVLFEVIQKVDYRLPIRTLEYIPSKKPKVSLGNPSANQLE